MESVRADIRPFALESAALPAWSRPAFGVAAPVIEAILGLTTLSRMYADATGSAVVEDFPERALAYLGITWFVGGEGTAAIPANGPLVVVANHAFGAVDGLILLTLLRTVRPDVKLLGNYLLARIPELRPILLEVDPFAGPGSNAMNAKMVRRAVDWTKRGGALIVFPAGEVSSVPAPGGRLVDASWRHGVGRVVAQSGAAVLPVYFEGRNSRLFELAGRLHPLVRTALLPRELLRKRGASVRLTTGKVIFSRPLANVGDRAAVMSYLRARTYGLAHADTAVASARSSWPAVAAANESSTIAQEVATLPHSRCLAEQGNLRVLYARASETPAVLAEIGRLRELTFRQIGEGTGQPSDLDRFDQWYVHLFVWDVEHRVIVGAYRLAPTDDATRSRGPHGLYTHTLFRYGRRFLNELGPALELGRSFVRPEYQREYAPLLLLWQGIAQFVVRHPRYRRLMGPVSVSAAYHPVSRDAIVNLLESKSLRSPLAAFARPRRSYRPFAMRAAPLAADVVAQLVKDLEPDGKSIPVLLRQYLKLHARTVATNVDPDFADAVDALMVVDLDALDARTLGRYMGAAGAAAFQQYLPGLGGSAKVRG